MVGVVVLFESVDELVIVGFESDIDNVGSNESCTDDKVGLGDKRDDDDDDWASSILTQHKSVQIITSGF
jgi:hypothetical protein